MTSLATQSKVLQTCSTLSERQNFPGTHLAILATMMGSVPNSLECRGNWVLFSSMLLKMERRGDLVLFSSMLLSLDWVLLSCSCYPGHEDCCYKLAALSNRCCFGETFVGRCKVSNVEGGDADVEDLTEIVGCWEER